MDMDYDSFLGALQKRGSKPHTISHCLGSRDAWKWVRRNKWNALGGNPCDQRLYSNIISHVDKMLIDSLLDGHEIQFPCGMGSLKLVEIPVKVALKDGKPEVNYCIDWKRTLQCWYEDEEMRKAHRTVKWVQKKKHFIRYYRKSATYRNRRFYSFRLNRSLEKLLGRASATRRLDAEPVEY